MFTADLASLFLAQSVAKAMINVSLGGLDKILKWPLFLLCRLKIYYLLLG